jgi:hypothetical protein
MKIVELTSFGKNFVNPRSKLNPSHDLVQRVVAAARKRWPQAVVVKKASTWNAWDTLILADNILWAPEI